jgi:hypothetical protein
MAANSSSELSLLSVLLARSAGNSCQNVTFPFDYSATAVATATSSSTVPLEPSTQPFSVPAQSTAVPPLSTGPLPITGTQVGELVSGALALLLAGVLVVFLTRRRHRGQVQ